MKESKFDGFYVVKNWSFQNDSKIGFRDKFDGSKIKVMVHPAPTDHLGLNVDERDQFFLKCTLET